MGVELPELQFTSLDEIPARISIPRKAFLEHKTRDVEFRLVQLRKLYWA
jgi:beta-apo-4'-carotenal oxygenase